MASPTAWRRSSRGMYERLKWRAEAYRARRSRFRRRDEAAGWHQRIDISRLFAGLLVGHLSASAGDGDRCASARRAVESPIGQKSGLTLDASSRGSDEGILRADW